MQKASFAWINNFSCSQSDSGKYFVFILTTIVQSLLLHLQKFHEEVHECFFLFCLIDDLKLQLQSWLNIPLQSSRGVKRQSFSDTRKMLFLTY